MTSDDTDTIASVIVTAVRAAIAPLEKRIVELESRDSVGIAYRGVYASGTLYPKGSAITRDGGLWLALRDTTLVPGTSPTSWKLIVKSGAAR